MEKLDITIIVVTHISSNNVLQSIMRIVISHHFSSSVSIKISIFLIYYLSLFFSSCQIYVNELIYPLLVD